MRTVSTLSEMSLSLAIKIPTLPPQRNRLVSLVRTLPLRFFGLVGELVGMSTTALIASNCAKATVMENSLLEKSSPYDIAKILTCT